MTLAGAGELRKSNRLPLVLRWSGLAPLEAIPFGLTTAETRSLPELFRRIRIWEPGTIWRTTQRTEQYRRLTVMRLGSRLSSYNRASLHTA